MAPPEATDGWIPPNPEPRSTDPFEAVRYDAATKTYRVRCDWSGPEAVSTVVVHAVADAAGTDPADLPPLHEHVDPDALNALFGPTFRGEQRSGGTVAFELADHRVRVDGDGTVSVRPPDADSSERPERHGPERST